MGDKTSRWLDDTEWAFGEFPAEGVWFIRKRGELIPQEKFLSFVSDLEIVCEGFKHRYEVDRKENWSDYEVLNAREPLGKLKSTGKGERAYGIDYYRPMYRKDAKGRWIAKGSPVLVYSSYLRPLRLYDEDQKVIIDKIELTVPAEKSVLGSRFYRGAGVRNEYLLVTPWDLECALDRALSPHLDAYRKKLLKSGFPRR